MALFCANRLAIGTANWGQEYNGVKVPESEQEKILDFCQEVGIDMIDTATAYEWDWTRLEDYFKVIVKVSAGDDISAIKAARPCWIMTHNLQELPCAKNIQGASLYNVEDCLRLKFQYIDLLQVPYSLYDRRFESLLSMWKECYVQIHVRSIFLRGRILEKATPHECISFCLMNPNVDRVIMGVDSLQQLQDNLAGLIKMDSLKVTDETILDPRQW